MSWGKSCAPTGKKSMKAILLLTLFGLAAASHVSGHTEGLISLLGHMPPVETDEEPVVVATRKYWRLAPVSSLAASQHVSDTEDAIWPGITDNQEVVPITAISEEDLIREKPVIKLIQRRLILI